MKKAIQKEHCPYCDNVLENINYYNDQVVVTDITERGREGEPLNGTYEYGYVICPNCKKKVMRYNWWGSMNGYDKIQKALKT